MCSGVKPVGCQFCNVRRSVTSAYVGFEADWFGCLKCTTQTCGCSAKHFFVCGKLPGCIYSVCPIYMFIKTCCLVCFYVKIIPPNLADVITNAATYTPLIVFPFGI